MSDQATVPRQPAMPIDPRIRRRRIAVKREEGRRRLRVVLAAAGAVGIGAGGWLVTRSALLDVDHVRVEGAVHVRPAEVLEAAGIRRGMAMTDVRDRAVAARVRRVPWVAAATVRRDWPNTVVISVREREPVATVRAAGGGWMLVDRTGRVLAPVPTPVDTLVAIEGTPPAGLPGERLVPSAMGALAVAAAIPPERVAQTRVVALLADGTVELRLAPAGPEPGGVVRFGPPERITEKLVAAYTVLDHIDRRGLSVLDVTVPEAPFVVRRGGSSA